MNALRYLNSVLTVLAVLLTLQLWTSWHGGNAAGWASPAEAETRTTPPAPGLPDAGAQRRDIIDLLKRQVQAADDLSRLLKSGQVRVRVEAGSGAPAVPSVKDAEKNG